MSNKVGSFVLGGKSRSRSATTLGGVSVDLLARTSDTCRLGVVNPMERRYHLDDAHDYDG